MGPVAIVIILLEATVESIKLLKGVAEAYWLKCTKFVPCGYCTFFARGDRRKRLEEKEKEKEK